MTRTIVVVNIYKMSGIIWPKNVLAAANKSSYPGRGGQGRGPQGRGGRSYPRPTTAPKPVIPNTMEPTINPKGESVGVGVRTESEPVRASLGLGACPSRQLIINQASELGPHGYTILKSVLTVPELIHIRKECTVVPILSTFVKNGPPPEKIPLYTETKEAIHLPRYIGTKLYGPVKCVLSPGENMHPDLKFNGKLRPEQQEVIDAFRTNSPFIDDNENGTFRVGGGVINVKCGGGKTVMGIKIAVDEINKATIIVVHKTFLADQWIERIQEYAPGARIGRVQGTTFDIENKDFVIVMIQTIYDKTYPPGTFSKFGLTIIDEAHRVCSSEYFKALRQIVTPCMIGLSATIEKKNGLESILYGFVGDKIYQGVGTDMEDDLVTVYAIHFRSEDEEYTNVPTNYMGDLLYSTLVSQISKFLPRIQFIVRVMTDMLNEFPDRQIIGLSFTRDLLNALQKGLAGGEKSQKYTTGFYVGGMAQDKLKDSESKNVVLATYSMAAEALDIKTLDSLFMASPKVDVVQAVGRILRLLTGPKSIIDLVDSHSTFQSQWAKRRKYYDSCGYTIVSTTSDEYCGIGKTAWKPYKSRNKKKCSNVGTSDIIGALYGAVNSCSMDEARACQYSMCNVEVESEEDDLAETQIAEECAW
jgi:superfamily II DNA or RNA helicase